MGPPLMRRSPKFVQGFVDRHGKARFYFPSRWLRERAASRLTVVTGVHGRLRGGNSGAANADRQWAG